MNPKEKDELREFSETLKYDLKYFVTESQEETLIITRPEADYLLSLMPAEEHPQPLDAGEYEKAYIQENPGEAYDRVKFAESFAQASITAKQKELNDVFKEAIYELWMYSGGEDQSSEIRKKLEKYHEITGMPWPEGELKYKPK